MYLVCFASFYKLLKINVLLLCKVVTVIYEKTAHFKSNIYVKFYF